MSKKSFEEFYNYYLNNQELYKHIQRRKEAMEISWNFCASQCESEIDGLRNKLEAAKTDNQNLKNKNASKSFKEYRYDKLAPSISKIGGWANFENFVNKPMEEIEELKKKLDEAVSIIEDLCSSVEECQERAKARDYLKGGKND